MLHLMTLLVVPFLVLLINSEETSAPSPVATTDLFSEDAKVITKELQKYKNDLDQSFDAFSNKLKQQNVVLDALNEYRQVHESIDNTNCKGEDLPIEDDEALIGTFIDDCTSTIPLDRLAAFDTKVKQAKKKVKAIDDKLMEDSLTCGSASTSCEDVRKKAVEEMNKVISAEAKADFEKDAKDVLTHAKKYVEECFTDEADELLGALQTATDVIVNCNSNPKQS